MFLIVGGSGTLGYYLQHTLHSNKLPFMSPPRSVLDITDTLSVSNFFTNNNKFLRIFLLAAETNVDLCETNPTQAYNVNVLGVENISKYAKIHGIPVTYISSSAVFGNDGKKWRYCELDFPNPSNLYGCSKLAGEKVVQSLVPDGLIVRSSWMIGGGPLRDKKFIAKILPKLKDNLELSVVHDKYGALTYAKDLADFLLIAHNNNYAGILHYASSDYTSRYDISQYVAKLVGSKSNITGIDSSTFPLNAPRAFSEALYSLLPCYQRKDWKTIIKEYIQEWQ